MTVTASPRAKIVERRTYLRPLDEEGGVFETFEQSVDRIIGHQKWLWQRALNRSLQVPELLELGELRQLLLDRKVTVSGRTRWLGGTEVSKLRECSQFNCSFVEVRDIYSLVDSLWLLLNGCGVGFRPVVGTLNGFARRIEEIEIIRSKMTMEIWNDGIRGRETNKETYDPETGVWRISVGDSAEAWAKSIGKLFAGKYPARKLILDFSQIRPAGLRLKGYGWISSGDESISIAYKAIAEIMNERAGQLLTRIDILDVMNWLGTILSSRRSSEIALVEVGEPEWEEFALAKKDFFLPQVNKHHRSQSNNSLVFKSKPSREQLQHIFDTMMEAGGSEPGFINGVESLRRAPWWKGTNPCLTDDAWVFTSDGARQIKDLIGVPFQAVVDGKLYESHGFWHSGHKDTVRIETNRGQSLRLTRDHRVLVDTGAGREWIKAGDLKPSDRIVLNNTQGFVWGNECDEESTQVLGELVGSGFNQALARAVENKASSSRTAAFLRGWFDKGSAVHDTPSQGTIVSLYSCNIETLRIAQRMLLRLGIVADLRPDEGNVGFTFRTLFPGAHALVISADMLQAFSDRVGFSDPTKKAKLSEVLSSGSRHLHKTDFTTKVVSVVDDEPADVYDCSVRGIHRFDANGMIVHNCGEILLGDKSFCVSGTTPLITRDGITRIQDAVDTPIDVWNGDRWSTVTPRVTGVDQEMVRVSFGDGSFLDCTPYHRFYVKDRFGKEYVEVQAKDLMGFSKHVIHTEPFKIDHTGGTHKDEAYTIGFYVGDGYSNHISIYNEAKASLPLAGVLVEDGEQNGKPKWRLRSLNIDWREATALKNDLSPVFSWDRASIIDFVSGLADADGSNTSHGAIRIYQGSEEFCRALQLLMTKVGIKSSVNLMTRSPSNFGTRSKEMWYVQITDVSELKCFRLSCTYTPRRQLKGKTQTIKAVTPLPGRHTSYCFTEPYKNKAVFNNTLTGQCNLVESVLMRFNGKFDELLRAHWIIARANYRQTCVNLDDGILSRGWHELNEFLRLCGAGVTSAVAWEHVGNPDKWQALRQAAVDGANSMADELHMPRPKAVTTVKPSGTASKTLSLDGMECPEGVHKPLGRYIFNNIIVSKHDPLVGILRQAGYHIFPHPFNDWDLLVRIPVEFSNVPFDKVTKVINNEEVEVEVNLESAVAQLNRYKMLQQNYVDHNTSITVSYSPDEVPEIIEWFLENWDCYVGVSFIYRNDPTKTAQDLGYPYLPQEVVDEKTFREYASRLKVIDLDGTSGDDEVDTGAECATGACPIR